MAVGAVASALAFPTPAPLPVDAMQGAARLPTLPRVVWFGIAGIAAMTLVQAMTFSFLEGVGSAIGPFLGGTLITLSGYESLALAAACLAVAAVFCFSRLPSVPDKATESFLELPAESAKELQLDEEEAMRASPTRMLTGTLSAALLLIGAATTTFAAGAEDALERFLIQELQSRYALAHDLTDPDMYAAVFTEDAELYGAGGGLLAKGREAFHAIGVNDRKRFNAGAADGERSFGALRHIVTNSVIELTSATTATGFCYVMTVVMRPEGGPEILSLGRYEDEYRKVDGEWLIAKREIVMDMGNSALAEATGLFGGP